MCIYILNLVKHFVLYFCWEILRKAMWWSEIRKKKPTRISQTLPPSSIAAYDRRMLNQGYHPETCTAHWLWPMAIISCEHWGWSQEKYEEYQEGLLSPGCGGKRLGNADSVFLDVCGQRERVWKVQLNLGSPEIFTGLAPQPGIQIFRMWDLLWENCSAGDWRGPSVRKGKKQFWL